MGWNDHGGKVPSSERRAYGSRCVMLELAQKHEVEAKRLRGKLADDPHAAQVHEDRMWDLLRELGLENLQVKVDG